MCTCLLTIFCSDAGAHEDARPEFVDRDAVSQGLWRLCKFYALCQVLCVHTMHVCCVLFCVFACFVCDCIYSVQSLCRCGCVHWCEKVSTVEALSVFICVLCIYVCVSLSALHSFRFGLSDCCAVEDMSGDNLMDEDDCDAAYQGLWRS